MTPVEGARPEPTRPGAAGSPTGGQAAPRVAPRTAGNRLGAGGLSGPREEAGAENWPRAAGARAPLPPPPPPPPPGNKLRRLKAEVGVCALAVLLYVNTLNAGFVYDDSRAVLRNADATGSSPWLAAFSNDFWGTPLQHSGSHGSYRPLTVLSLRLNALAALKPGSRSISPAGFHLVNVLLHGLVSVLVLQLGLRLTSRWPATVAGLLFAAHPVHCEAVAGVVGRADLLCAAFYLLSLLCYIRYVDRRELHRCAHHTSAPPEDVPPPSKDLINVVLDRMLLPQCKRGARGGAGGGGGGGGGGGRGCPYCGCWSAALLGSSLLLAVCAMLSKEPGITVLPVCFVYELLIQLRRFRKRVRVERSGLVVLVAACCALLGARLWLMGLRAPSFASADNPTAHLPSLLARTLTFLHLPAVNLGLLLWPRWLSFDWSMDAVPRVTSLDDPRNAVTLAMYLALWRCARGAWGQLRTPLRLPAKVARKLRTDMNNNNNNNNNNNKEVQLGHGEVVLAALALLVLPALPATNLFFYVGFVVAERVLYLPSVGFCLLVALGAHRLRALTRLTNVLLALTLAALAARTLVRNMDWHDEEALYRSGIPINPAKSYGNLGSVLSAANRLAEAEHAYRMALKYRPNMAEVHYNLGNLLAANKKYEASATSYGLAIRYRPTLALAYVNLGHILVKLGRIEDAGQVFKDCALIPPTGLKDPVAHQSARASALYHLANLHLGVGNLWGAKQALDLALEVKPPQHEPGPIMKLMEEVVREMINTTNQKEKEHPSEAKQAASIAEKAPLLNESRCTTGDGHRLLSHS